ncbi:hypothetical protein ACWOA2_03540 [Granulicatella elegans]|uniref:Uncharacterized protein n=1 Tax=Granulicatella elegans ATCC 700633 TaxID=626369 RepID=D0BLY6_9LACT|nr:hypothetical protein [Granulicatella elegans]EEW93001.1 hypothetical protein HMPREF0446_00989 [Granulicatella elegans ATCC 700633]
MRKDENAKEKQVNITGRRIWVTAIIINVIPILIKLFNVLYFKHSFGEEFNYPYSISLVTILFLFVVTAIIEKKKNKIF